MLIHTYLPLTNETRHVKWHEYVNVCVDQIKLFVIVNNDGMKINVDVNVKN